MNFSVMLKSTVFITVTLGSSGGALARWVSPDPLLVGNPKLAIERPLELNGFSYSRNNPISYRDPSGTTTASALREVAAHSRLIVGVAEKHRIPARVLAGVVFAERTTRVYEAATDPISKRWGENPSVGLTQVSVGVAHMMDHPEVIPEGYAQLSYAERVAVGERVAAGLSAEERTDCVSRLESSIETSVDYSARYLRFLSEQRGGYQDDAVWVSDYNRGLTITTQTPNSYGERFQEALPRIEQALTGENPETSVLEELW